MLCGAVVPIWTKKPASADISEPAHSLATHVQQGMPIMPRVVNLSRVTRRPFHHSLQVYNKTVDIISFFKPNVTIQLVDHFVTYASRHAIPEQVGEGREAHVATRKYCSCGSAYGWLACHHDGDSEHGFADQVRSCEVLDTGVPEYNERKCLWMSKLLLIVTHACAFSTLDPSTTLRHLKAGTDCKTYSPCLSRNELLLAVSN